MNLPVEESEFVPCDILDIVRYIRRRNPDAATRFIDAFKSTIEQLSKMPKVGKTRADLGMPEVRSWRIRGFRNYLVFYDLLSGFAGRIGGVIHPAILTSIGI